MSIGGLLNLNLCPGELGATEMVKTMILSWDTLEERGTIGFYVERK